MAKQRVIDPGIFSHPWFRQQPWYVRDVFIYLFAVAADDEGRFRVDAAAILDGAFGRSHPVTQDDVEATVQALVESGRVVVYDDCGFLTGWYEHQKIDKRWRSESALTAPPADVVSWDDADAVREAYRAQRGVVGRTASYRDAIRWFSALTPEQRATITRDTRETLASNTRATREKHGSNTRATRETLAKDGDGDVNTSTSTASAQAREASARASARAARNGTARRTARASPQPAAPEPPQDPMAIWEATHGPRPKDERQSIFYTEARKLWMQGGCRWTEAHGYKFPPPLPADEGDKAA